MEPWEQVEVVVECVVPLKNSTVNGFMKHAYGLKLTLISSILSQKTLAKMVTYVQAF